MNGPFLLTLIWIVPFLAALLSLPVARKNHVRIKMISLVGNLINLMLVIVLTVQFIDIAGSNPVGIDAGSSLFHYHYKIPWFKIMNIEYNIGVDAISVLMMLLTAIVIFCGILASWEVKGQAKEFFILLNILVAGVYGVFVFIDLFTLFLFYEIAVLPMYLLIGLWGTGRKEYAAMKLTLMLVAGSAFILAGILALYFESGLSTFVIYGRGTVEKAELLQQRFKPVYRIIHNKFYIDEIYLFVTHKIIFRFIATPVKWVDRHIVDGAMNLFGDILQLGGKAVRLIQNGQLQFYLGMTVAGFVVLLLIGK